jgi:hypothetical protein
VTRTEHYDQAEAYVIAAERARSGDDTTFNRNIALALAHALLATVDRGIEP